MLRQFIAASAIALLSAAASADSIIATGSSARPSSVSYIGYDSFDADGNPVCTPCLQKTEEEKNRLKAYAERRARSREYMARMQGNAAPPNALTATTDSPPGEKADARTATQAAETPLRAEMN